MKLCIVVPMFNEEVIARESLETILPYVKQLPITAHLLVVDDGSKDKTADNVNQLVQAHKPHLVLVSHQVNKGYGAALRTGMHYAITKQYDYVLFIDSDLTNHPRYIEAFYEKMLQDYDYIKANRYARQGGVVGVPLSRRIISYFGNMLARILYGLPLQDLTNGFRAVKTSILSQINLKENGFAIIMEELYQLKYIAQSFAEVPYVLTGRQKQHGKSHFTYDFNTYARYLGYAWRSFVKTPINRKTFYEHRKETTR